MLLNARYIFDDDRCELVCVLCVIFSRIFINISSQKLVVFCQFLHFTSMFTIKLLNSLIFVAVMKLLLFHICVHLPTVIVSRILAFSSFHVSSDDKSTT